MRLYLCANCGLICTEAYLQANAVAMELDPLMQKIIKTNGLKPMLSPTCPNCHVGNKLLYTDMPDLYIPTQIGDVAQEPKTWANPPSSAVAGETMTAKVVTLVETKKEPTTPASEDVDEALLLEALASAEMPEQNRLEEVPVTKAPDEALVAQAKAAVGKVGERTEDTGKRNRKIKCDACGKDVVTKIPGVSRCQECINNLIK